MKLNHILALAIVFAIVLAGCNQTGPDNQNNDNNSNTVQPLTTTTKSLSATISPARDLTGTWTDIPGEGLVFTIIAGPHRFHDEITMAITQKGNTFSGTMWVSIWKVDILNPDVPYDFSLPTETIAVPVTDGLVEGNNIRFKAMTWNWDGTFTNDIMKGTITGYDARSGVHYTGEFNLRKK